MSDRHYRVGKTIFFLAFIISVIVSSVLCAITLGANSKYSHIYYTVEIVALFFMFFMGKKNRLSRFSYTILLAVLWEIVALCCAYFLKAVSIYLISTYFCGFLLFLYYEKKVYYFLASMVAVSMGVFIVFYYVRPGIFPLHTQDFIGEFLVIVGLLLYTSIIKLYQAQERQARENERSMDDIMNILNEKCDEARLGVKSKSDFLSNMSHEIRTPINSVLGMNEMILRENKNPDIMEYARNIESAGHVLLALVNDILDFSKIESGKMDIIKEKYQVFSLFHDLIIMFDNQFKTKELKFILDIDQNIPSVLYGDVVRLRQIITNLLSNALKYTKTGHVKFSVGCEKTKNGSVYLKVAVEDTGIGIKEEDLAELFVAFQRIEEKRNRSIQGTGLGLNIASKMLVNMNSELKVKSVYGKGTKFYFDIEQDVSDEKPIGNILEYQEEVEENKYEALLYAPKANVLVVDDNEMNRKVFVSLLKQTGIVIAEAASGMECLEKVRVFDYDIIFLDHMMPEMDGIEALKQIRKENLCKDTPIIALTANAVAGARELYMSSGFTDFMTKPISPKRLEEAVLFYLPEELLEEPPEEVAMQLTAKEEDSSVDIDDLPIVDGIDWQYAMTHFPDKEMLMSAINDFYYRIEPEASTLEMMYLMPGRSDWEDYKITVHGMKSAAAIIGAFPLSGPAKILEDAAGANDEGVIHALTPVFLNEWRSFKTRLKVLDMFDEPKADDLEEDNQVVLALLDMLKNASAQMDMDSMDEYSAELAKYKLPDNCADKFEALQGAVIGLDVDTINNLSDEIMDAVRESL